MSDNPSESTVTPRRRKSGGVVTAVLLVAVLAALGGGGWYGWQFYQQLIQQTRQQADRVADLEGEVQQLRSGHQEQLAGLREDLEDVRAETAARRKQLQELRSGGQTTWLLNEAQALASLAQQRLLLSGDRAAAERLLEAADRVLARMDNPDLTPVRQALAADLEKVRGARQVDTTRLVLRLGGLRSLVADLVVPAGTRRGSEAEPESAEADGDETKPWWHRLPLTVRRHEEPLPLPLDDTSASLVRLQLFNDLQRAQLALMHSRPRVYHDALDQALTTLESWLAAERPRVKQLREALKELEQAPVEQALPETGDGLDALRGFIRQRGESS